MIGRLAEKLWAKRIPVGCSFELTWRCNLNCRFCYQYRNDDNELKLNEIKRILDELADSGCLFLSLTGGEPLLRRDFWDIAEYAKKRHFALTLQTNGTLINKDSLKRIKKLNFFEVHITLLGAKAQTHDWFTQSSGSFDKVIKAIELLRTDNIKVMLKITLMKQNFSELEGMNRIARRFGCRQFKSSVVTPRSNGDKAPYAFRMNDRQMKNFYSELFKKNPREKKLYESYAGDPMLNCGAGFIGLAINPVGEVYPCVALPVSVGSLRKNSLSQIWNTSDYLKKIRETKLDDLTICSKCRLLSICMRCKGMAYLEAGSIVAPSKEFCRITNIIKEVMDDEKEKV